MIKIIAEYTSYTRDVIGLYKKLPAGKCDSFINIFSSFLPEGQGRYNSIGEGRYIGIDA